MFNIFNGSQFVIILLTGAAIVGCSEYGPPILSLARSPSAPTTTQLPFPLPRKQHVRYLSEKMLNLEDFPNYATVLPLTDGRSWMKSEELIETLGKDNPNEGFVPFVITPPKDHGIMVVIQELQIPAFNTFNRSVLVIDDNGRILECFSKFVFQIEGRSPVDVCGRTNDQLQYRPSVIDGVGPRSFVVPAGKSITVNFIYRDEQIDQSKTLKKQVPFYDMGYLFRASIAFTAYKACPHGPPFNEENGIKTWPCDIPQSNREAVAACIPEALFCDNIINCGMHDSKEFAVDERFCVEKVVTKNESKSLVSHHGQKHIRVDTVRLEEAIRNRIISPYRPFGYSDNMVIQMGTGKQYSTEPLDKSDAMSHPAFVALIILITIICVLIVGLIFRYCCKPCVGKSDPFAHSSNPEAVARFHENLRTRDNDPPPQGRAYGVSLENVFKPVDDLPPSYSDLFPSYQQESPVSHHPNNLQKPYQPSSMHPNSNPNEVVVNTRPSDYSHLPVYSIPVSFVTPSSSSDLSSRSVNSATSSSSIDAPPYILNPSVLQLEVFPGNGNSPVPLGRANHEPIIFNSSTSSSSTSISSTATYTVASTSTDLESSLQTSTASTSTSSQCPSHRTYIIDST